ncbi:hypothetical protein [Nonomuraea wenchangensis]|uniref:hypothetical protein n=1 Tax=Nonomuraea wenchangensis TaxID=568860 RepID=UPI000B87E5CF|nr:hypothetical protein [Nonomuraea wenchangensis]
MATPPALLERFSQRADGRPGLGEALLGALREAIAELSHGRAVVEGRSVDTTAVCQALLLPPATWTRPWRRRGP